MQRKKQVASAYDEKVAGDEKVHVGNKEDISTCE